MDLGLQNRGQYANPQAIEDELDRVTAAVSETWKVEHNPDGTHVITNPTSIVTANALASQYIDWAAGSGPTSIKHKPTLGSWALVDYPAWASGTPFLKMTAAGVFSLDTNTYLTGNQTVTLSGAVTGSGATSISASLAENIAGAANLKGTGSAKLANGSAGNLLKSLGDGTFGWDTSSYLTGNQSITLGGILSGSGTTSITAAAASGYYMPSTTDQSNWNGKQAAYANLTSIGGLTNSAGWLHNNGSGTFAYSTPSKSDVGLGSVENTALSTWAGTSNVTTLGTVTTGVWNAGAVTSSGAVAGTSMKPTGGSTGLALNLTGQTALSVNNDATASLGYTDSGTNFTGWLWIGCSGNGITGLFGLGNGVAYLIWSNTIGSTGFTATSGTANKANVYYSGGTLTLENKLGATRSFKYGVFQMTA